MEQVSAEFSEAIFDEAIAREQVMELVRDFYRRPWDRRLKTFVEDAIDDWADCLERMFHAHESQRTQVVAALLG